MPQVENSKGTVKAPARTRGRGNAYGHGNGNAYGHAKRPAAPPATGNGNGIVKLPKAPKLPAVPKLPAEPKVRAVPVSPKSLGTGKNAAGE